MAQSEQKESESAHMQTNSSSNSANRAPNPIWLRRAGIALVVLMIAVFGTELTLARLRGREVTVSLNVLQANGIGAGTPVPANSLLTPTSAAGSATTEPSTTKAPTPVILTVTPDDQLLVTVNWHYTIGPRFPHTTIHVTAVINGRTVSDGQVKIDCGTAVINCDGVQTITLVYTVPDLGNGVQQVAWPVGDYQLVVDRSDASLAPIRLQTTDFHVR